METIKILVGQVKADGSRGLWEMKTLVLLGDTEARAVWEMTITEGSKRGLGLNPPWTLGEETFGRASLPS